MIKTAIGIACIMFLAFLALYLFYTVILKESFGHKKFVQRIDKFLTPRWVIEGVKELEMKEKETKEKQAESKPES